MDEKRQHTFSKNPLLHSANFAFDSDSFRPLTIVPSTLDPAVTEGQDFDVLLNDTSEQNAVYADTAQLSVPASEQAPVENNPPLFIASAETESPFSSFLQTIKNVAVPSLSSNLYSAPVRSEPEPTVAQTKGDFQPVFFHPAKFSSGTTSTSKSANGSDLESGNCNSTSTSGLPPATGKPASNTYRLTNLKKPTYAPIPSLNFGPSAFNPLPQKQLPTSTLSNTFWQSNTAHSEGSVLPASDVSGGTVLQPNFNIPAGRSDLNNSVGPSENPRSDSDMYHPVYHHWFYRVDSERNWFYQKDPDVKSIWKPFSMTDSLALESAFSLPSLTDDTVVATDGGRYDVFVKNREKIAAYWEQPALIVRRCSWFYKGAADGSYVPYEEETAIKLEEEYRKAMISGIWDRRIDMGNNEEIIMRSATSMIHQVKTPLPFDELHHPDAAVMQVQLKPRTVKRGGFDEFDISDGEPETVDHLLFLIHGIGQFCDLKFRSIIEVVDEFRNISLELVQTHFEEACDLGHANRIEILPISWHKMLHSEDTGIDARLKNITLPSVPRLRDFANDTILDVLFYHSPMFCQVIINAVALEMNKLYALFVKRNPNFQGKVSVGGHSLGSLIVFDILSHQKSNIPPHIPTTTNEEDENGDIDDEDTQADLQEFPSLSDEFSSRRRAALTRRISYISLGCDGTGQPYVKYPRIHFHPRFFFAFGSPIGCFVASRSSEILGENFRFPTCPGFFNIFHPYDLIAYRIEPLIIPTMSDVKPVQIPHHKGRKRMHLELKETVTNVGQKLLDTVKKSWNMVFQYASAKAGNEESEIQQEVNRIMQTQDPLRGMPPNPGLTPNEPTMESTDMKVGCINEGRRVDYVLQETPLEYINEYIFAFASHLCYWTSRDTMLLLLREIYGDMGIYSDKKNGSSPAPFDTSSRGSISSTSSINTQSAPTSLSAVDPTLPMKDSADVGPPPTKGFVRK